MRASPSSVCLKAVCLPCIKGWLDAVLALEAAQITGAFRPPTTENSAALPVKIWMPAPSVCDLAALRAQPKKKRNSIAGSKSIWPSKNSMRALLKLRKIFNLLKHDEKPETTIRKIVGFLNNPEEEGGFWLPNIQRPFVWGEEQIYRLFDSILREYPISTLLIWKTNSTIRRRKFIDNWKDSIRLVDFYVPSDTKKKCLVLDGQQRLQSLFIALTGSFEGRELYFDILSGELAATR